MTVAAGIEIGPEVGQLRIGLPTAAARLAVASSAGKKSFQSSWQSMMAALGAESKTGGAQKPAPDAEQNTPLAVAAKTARPSAVSDPATEALPNQAVRVQPDPGAVVRRETVAAIAVQEDAAPSGSAHGAGWENSGSAGKSVKRDSSVEKNPAAARVSAEQATAAVAVAAMPVTADHALPIKPSAGIDTVHRARSLLTPAFLASGRAAAVDVEIGMQKAVPAGVVSTAAGNSSLASGAKQENTDGEAQAWTNAGRAPLAAADAATASIAQIIQVAQPGPQAAAPAAGGTNALPSAGAGIAGAVSVSAESASAARPALAGDRRVHETEAPRALHGSAETAALASAPSHAPSVQPIGTGVETTAPLARDAGGGRSAMNAMDAAAAGSGSIGSASTGAHETFAALDAAAAHGANWLHAGTHSAEAGFEDPTLGWVSVRADLAAGGVHAAVVPGTADAAQALSAHMAGLNSYLSEHRTPVQTLTLATPGGAGFNPAAGQGSGQNDGAGRQASPQTAAPPGASRAQTAARSGGAIHDAAPAAMRAGASISLIA